MTPGDAVFIGDCQLGWNSVLDRNGEWITTQAALADDLGKCPLGEVRGTVKVFMKWIPVGHAESKYDANCNKLDAV